MLETSALWHLFHSVPFPWWIEYSICDMPQGKTFSKSNKVVRAGTI